MFGLFVTLKFPNHGTLPAHLRWFCNVKPMIIEINQELLNIEQCCH
jgi:hypothetical protein